MTSVRHRIGRISPAAGAAAAVIICCAINLWYFHAETHPPTFDDAWYLEIACKLYYALRDNGPAAFYRAYASAFLFKAPLISVLALPPFFLFGPSHDTALLVNLAATIMLGGYVFLLGRRLFSQTAGLLAVLITLTLPLIAGLTHRFFVEIALTAVVSAVTYHLAASDGLRRRTHVRAVGALAGAGLLLKVLFPMFVIGALADVLWRRWRESRGGFLRAVEPPLKTIVAISGLIALTWYAHNLIYTAGYIYMASFGKVAAHYGDTRVFNPAVLFGYWHKLIENGLSYYYFLASAAVAAALLYRHRRGLRPLPLLISNSSLSLLLSWLLVPLFFGTVGVNKAIRFMTPALPAFSLLLAGGLDLLTRNSRLRAALLSLFFAIPAAGYALQTFGVKLFPAVQIGPASFLKPGSTYSGPPQREGLWRQQELVDWIWRETGKQETKVALGTEIGYLNSNNLNYFSARRNYPLRFVSYGYNETRVERTLARLRDKDVDHLLLVDGLPDGILKEDVRRLETQIRELLRDRRLPFIPGPTFQLTDTISATLHRRTAPIPLIGAPAPRRSR
ncbi:MAG: glycosyltransferase family 39 protein [Elusimicrobiota bacterium]